MKKLGVIVLLLLFLFGFIGSFVSAQEIIKPLAEGAERFYNTIFKPFGQFLLGKDTGTGEIFFAKLLFFILLVTIVNFALSSASIPVLSNKSWWISVIVSILSVRYMSSTWISTIVLPYSALGITLTCFFPLLIYFFFVEKGLGDYSSLRKIAWVFAAVVFFGLYLYRDVSQFPVAPSDKFQPDNIYLISAVICLVVLTFERRIRVGMDKLKYGKDAATRASLLRSDCDIAHEKILREFYSMDIPTTEHVQAVNRKIKALNLKLHAAGGPQNAYTELIA